MFMRSAVKHLLRGSLRTHVAEMGTSTERLVTVEFTAAIPRPSDGGDTSMPDWVGSVAACGGGHLVAGCYDGQLRVVAADGAVAGEVAGHEGAVKAVAHANGVVVSGGHDKTIRLWQMSGGSLVPVRLARPVSAPRSLALALARMKARCRAAGKRR